MTLQKENLFVLGVCIEILTCKSIVKLGYGVKDLSYASASTDLWRYIIFLLLLLGVAYRL